MSEKEAKYLNKMEDTIEVGDATQIGEDIGFQKVDIPQSSFSDEVS